MKLEQYISEIRNIQRRYNCTPSEALGKFIMNLATMKEHFGSNPHLNFHELGQQWNRLNSEERNAQRESTLKLLTKSPMRGP